MLNRGMMLAAIVALSGAATGIASGQVASLANPSYESPSVCNPFKPDGWRFYNAATWHSNDTVTAPNAQPLPAGILPRTGGALIRLGTGVDFAGCETEDKLVPPGNPFICFDPGAQLGFPYPWPAYTFKPALDSDPTNMLTCGDTPAPPDPVNVTAGDPVTVSGWYLIPADQPLVGTKAGMKVVFKKDFVADPSQLGNYYTFEQLTIDGTVPGGVHTNGQWQQFTMTFDMNDFPDPQHCDPPEPNTTQYAAITVLHFAGSGNTANTGVIYWDDISFTQGSPACPGDFNGSGSVTADDIFAFLDAWFAQNGQTGSGLSADVNNSGGVTADDIFAYLDLWFANNGNTCP